MKKALTAILLGTTLLVAQQSPTMRPHPQERHFRNIQRLTTGGENAEAYFSADGKKIILQSTHDPYKCGQIFTMSADQQREDGEYG
jgi:hypothetical protein